MKCTDEEWKHCRVEKMGCRGCYYDDSILEEAIKIIKDVIYDGKGKPVYYIDISFSHGKGDIGAEELIKAIEIVLRKLESYKRLAEANLKDSEEFKNNMCEHRCILKSELQELQENSIPKKKIEDKIFRR